MNTKELNAFYETYECRSINQAAKKLFISAQGLSKIISNLENELEADLFVRAYSGVVPTAAGDYLYAQSGKILESIAELQNGIRQVVRNSSVLRIGFSCGVTNLIPMELISEFEQTHPQCTLYLEDSLNDLIQQSVFSRDMDVAFVVGPPTVGEMKTVPVLSDRLDLLVYEGHPFYDRESVSVEELRDEPVVSLNEHFHSFKAMMDACRAYSFEPNVVAKTLENRMVIETCRRKKGVGFAVSFSLDGIDAQGLRLVRFREELPWEVNLICRRDTDHYPAVADFISFIREKYAR